MTLITLTQLLLHTYCSTGGTASSCNLSYFRISHNIKQSITKLSQYSQIFRKSQNIKQFIPILSQFCHISGYFTISNNLPQYCQNISLHQTIYDNCRNILIFQDITRYQTIFHNIVIFLDM